MVKDTLDVFTARDLRNRAGGLLKDAEEGRLSLITKHGHPAIIAVPFDASLVEQGVHRRLAVQLLGQGLVTLAQAAKLAGLTIAAFLDVLKTTDVTLVNYPPAELKAEVESLR